MNLFKNCFASIKRRPFIIIFFSIIAIIFCAIEQFNPIIAGLRQLKKFSSGNIFNDLISLIKTLFGNFLGDKPAVLVASIVVGIFGILAISAISSLFVSGYSHILNISLDDKPKAKGEFIAGISKHYFKYLLYLFINIILTILFILGFTYATYPASLCLNEFLNGNSDLIIAVMFFILITVFVLFFALVFYMMYTLFMYPALASFKKGAFIVSRKVVNAYFWFLVPRYTFVIVIFVLVQVLLSIFNYGEGSVQGQVVIFILNSIFKSIFGFLFIYFNFLCFRTLKNELQNHQDQDEQDDKSK